MTVTTRRRGKLPKTARKAQSAKIGQLVREGYPQRQAVAISFSEYRRGGVKRLRQSHAKRRRGRR